MGILAVPLIDAKVTSAFGVRKDPFGEKPEDFHKGVDFAAPVGTVVIAAREGIVDAFNENSETLGKLLILKHADGTKTRYAHMSRILVPKVGLKINQRQAIGLVGSTGRSTGPHLHFEYLDKNGAPMDPGPMLGFVTLEVGKEVHSREIDLFPSTNFLFMLAAGAAALTVLATLKN